MHTNSDGLEPHPVRRSHTSRRAFPDRTRRFVSITLAVLTCLVFMARVGPAGAQANANRAGTERCDASGKLADSAAPPTERSCLATDKTAAPASTPASAEASAAVPPELSDQERTVSEIADGRGDKTYLMIDKLMGEVILFDNGQPIFSGPALTGVSLGDDVPPASLKAAFSQFSRPDYKVTPAGRFTLKRENDPEYGTVFTINEVQGKDWDIAVHRVYLGTPSEHRAERLRSPNAEDRHITYGCINVTKDAIPVLARHLTGRRIPVYILPTDVTRTLAFFASDKHVSAAVATSH
jgi:hypothetical protein